MKRFMIAVAAALVFGATLHAQVTPEQQQQIDAALPAKATYKPRAKHKALIWSRATGFRHKSIPHGAYAMKKMGEKSGVFTADETTDLLMLLPEVLKNYDILILNNTTGDWVKPITDADDKNAKSYGVDERLLKKYGSAYAAEQALRKSITDFVNNGGALVGYHSASDANYHWPEFGKMIGGYFNHHPWGANDTVTVHIDEPKHKLLRAFAGKEHFEIKDEIYQFKDPYSRENQRVLLSLDTQRTDMNKKNIQRTDGDFGVSWIREQGKGRVFYSSLGHREEIFWNPMVMQYYLDGIQWAAGDTDAPAKPKARSVAAADVDGEACPHCAADKKDGSEGDWVNLNDLSKWDFPARTWAIEDGVLTLKESKKNNIWTKQEFGDFVLDFEFKVDEGTNSGVFFRADPKNPVQGGFEIQIFDSHAKAEVGKHDSGALYDALAPSRNAMKPQGEWNHMILTAVGPRVTVILNDQKIIEANLDHWKERQKNPDGTKNKFKTALKDLPRTGHIGFQDHGDWVWFRNVRIKRLD